MVKTMITVIIPSFNSASTIEHVFEKLDNQSRKDLISEIVVVDSSNDRETRPIIARHGSDKIKVIDAGIGVMPAIGRNIGAAHANGEILAFLDADAFPAYNWIENIAKVYENGCIVGGGGINIADFQKNNLIVLAQYYLQFNEFISSGSKSIKKFVPSCNMFCSKELFQKSGGFPEIRAAEDVLFGLKVSEIANLWFIPEIVVYHIFRLEWKKFLRNQILLGKYVSIYRKNHYDSFIYKGIMPIIFLPIFLLIKLFRIVWRISQTGWCNIYRFIISVPVFLVGLLFWSIGFIKGCLNNNESPKR